MAYNGSGGKRLCTGTDLDVERSNGNNYMSGEPRRKREPPARPNHILLYTIINPAYPITVPSTKKPTIVEEDDEFLHKKEKIDLVKPKAKITVPSLRDFKDVESSAPVKPKAPSSKKSGLLSILPQPRNGFSTTSTTSKSLLPHVLQQKNNIKKPVAPPPAKKPKKLIDDYSDDSDNDEDVQNDFFSIHKPVDPIPEAPVDLEESLQDKAPAAPQRSKLESFFKPDPIQNEVDMEPPPEESNEDVVHTISSPHGQVQRIVVFKKNGVQAMVEFDTVESATRAKEALHGCDIYSGCCTLKIEFAKPERLNVFKNDQDSWDYTLSEEIQPAQRSAPLLQSPQYTGGRPQPYNPAHTITPRPCSEDASSPHSLPQTPTNYEINDMEFGSGGPPPGMMKDRHGPPPPHHPRDGRGYGPEGYGGEGFAPPMHHPAMPPQNQLNMDLGGPPQQGAVMMVYGLDPQTVNADRLFNLCCLYGNVVRIKFLKTKEGTAMVQMGDGVSVERCVQNLNNVTVGDHTLTLAFSKQAYLSEVMNPYPLPDKSPSFKDYVGNKNNRFLTPASIHKNRIQPPSKVVHFFNTPPDVSEEQLLQVFTDYGVQPPHTISKFPLKSDRSSSGLMEFQNISQSVMAIMACNHATIQHPGAKFPFVMKLCFSSSRQIGQGKNQNNKNDDKRQDNGVAEHEYY